MRVHCVQVRPLRIRGEQRRELAPGRSTRLGSCVEERRSVGERACVEPRVSALVKCEVRQQRTVTSTPPSTSAALTFPWYLNKCDFRSVSDCRIESFCRRWCQKGAKSRGNASSA